MKIISLNVEGQKHLARVRDVRVECGISDHCAVIAEVLRSR